MDNYSKHPGGLLAIAALALSAIALIGSVLLMLYGFRRNPSIFLLCFFVIWVSSPFILMMLIVRVTRQRQNFPHATLHVVMIVVAVCSLAIYAKHVVAPLSVKFGFPFIVFPPTSWLFASVVVGLAALVTRRRSIPT